MAKKKPSTALDLTDVQPEVVEAAAAPLVERATDSRLTMAQVVIDSQDDYKLVVQGVAEIKEEQVRLDSIVDAFVKPLEQVIKLYKGYFRPATDALKEAERYGKRALETFIVRSEATRDRLINASARAPNEDAREAMLIEADSHRVDPVAGVQVRTLWTGRVIDASLIPRQYLVPDVATLNAITKAKKGDPEIPGWEAVPSASIAVTTSKVEK